MRKNFKRIAFLVLLGLWSASVFAADAGAQAKKALNVRLSQIDSTKFPKMKAYVTIEDEMENLVPGLDAKIFDFSVDDRSKSVKNVKVTPFLNTNEGVSYNILFSSNQNLGSGMLNYQTQSLMTFVEQLTDNDSISIYTMSDTAKPVCENIRKDKWDFTAISTLKASDDNARLYDSIADLIKKVAQRKEERKVIIVISDEKDYQSKLTPLQFIDLAESSGIPLFTIGIRSPSTSTQVRLEDMSNYSNGRYFYCPQIRNLSATLERISNYVSNSYVVTLKVRGQRADNRLHTLSLGISVRDSFGSSTKKFTAFRQKYPWWIRLIALAVILVIIALIIVLLIFSQKNKRKRMGITNRRCPDCGNRMKDTWDTCPFCYYMPELKKKGKKKKDKKGKKGKKKK